MKCRPSPQHTGIVLQNTTHTADVRWQIEDREEIEDADFLLNLEISCIRPAQMQRYIIYFPKFCSNEDV